MLRLGRCIFCYAVGKVACGPGSHDNLVTTNDSSLNPLEIICCPEIKSIIR